MGYPQITCSSWCVQDGPYRSVGQAATYFSLTETAVREWVMQAERGAETRQDGSLTSVERKELAELRAENRGLREGVDTLKRTAAFFGLVNALSGAAIWCRDSVAMIALCVAPWLAQP